MPDLDVVGRGRAACWWLACRRRLVTWRTRVDRGWPRHGTEVSDRVVAETKSLLLPASAVRWLAVPVVATRRGHLGSWSRLAPGCGAPVLHADRDACVSERGSGSRACWRRRATVVPPAVERDREPEAGGAGVVRVAAAGRLGVGVVCLLPPLVVGVKGGGVRMEVRGGEWAVATGWLGSPSVGRVPREPQPREHTPGSPSVHLLARASQAEAAASGTSVAHPCHNQADPP